MKFSYLFLFILGFVILSCEGKQGPIGPQGPPGIGTRIVYSGTAGSDEVVVDIPELHINDFPSINCYYFLDGSWSELYLDYEDNNESILPYALIEEQKVILLKLSGLDYKIVIII